MISCLTALSSGTRNSPISSGPGGCTPYATRVMEPGHEGQTSRSDPGKSSGSSRSAGLSGRQHLSGPPDVLGHLLDQGLDAFEPDHAPQPPDELHAHPLAVEIQTVAGHDVDDERLDPTLGA